MCTLRILSAAMYRAMLKCSQTAIIHSMEARKTLILEEQQFQTNHKYAAPTRYIKFFDQLYMQVQDLHFLLRLPEKLNNIKGALGYDTAAQDWETIRFLNRVRKYLGRELKGRRCGAAILELYEACLENIAELEQFPKAAVNDNSHPIQCLNDDCDWAIQQNIQNTKDILLMVGLAESSDFISW